MKQISFSYLVILTYACGVKKGGKHQFFKKKMQSLMMDSKKEFSNQKFFGEKVYLPLSYIELRLITGAGNSLIKF